MADRKSVLRPAPERPELDRLLAASIKSGVTEDVLREQRISFVYGNAPKGSRFQILQERQFSMSASRATRKNKTKGPFLGEKQENRFLFIAMLVLEQENQEKLTNTRN